MKADAPIQKPSTSTQINDTITLADVMRKFKSMDDSQNVKYKLINEKLISYDSKINVTLLNDTLTAINTSRDSTQKNEISCMHSKKLRLSKVRIKSIIHCRQGK